jgi:hypothetical protein
VGKNFSKRSPGYKTPVVFVLDEFPMMIDRMARSEAHREEAKTLLHWLRTIRQSPDLKNVRFLIAGSIGIGRVLNELGEINAINDFEQVRLEPFTQKVATAFIDELAKTKTISLDDPTKRQMLDLMARRFLTLFRSSFLNPPNSTNLTVSRSRRKRSHRFIAKKCWG